MNRTPIIIGIVVLLLLALIAYGLATRWNTPLFRALNITPAPSQTPVPTFFIPSPTVLPTPATSISPTPTSGLQKTPTLSPVTPSPVSVYGIPVRQFFIGSELTVPGTNQKITLNEGSNQINTNQGQVTITLGDQYTVRQVGDGLDVIGFINVSLAGSQNQQQYLILYQATPQTKLHTSSVLIGNNIRVLSIRTGDTPDPERYGAIVNYLDRREGEPLSVAPTINKETIFEVENHLFVQEISDLK